MDKKHSYFSLSTLFKYSTLIISLLYILVYLIIAFNRFIYPYELEWMEGATVNNVLRVFSGQELYAEPSLEFIPIIYTPLYYYVCAVFSKFLGIGFLPLRLVSILASLGCFIILFEFVRRETRSIILGIFSAGLFAATFRISGAWFDIARADSLFMFFLLWGLFLVKFNETGKSLLFAGFLISLAFLTKQTALLVAVVTSFYCIYYMPKRSKYIFPATFMLTIGLSSFVLNSMSDGWYYYYVFDLPKQHKLMMEMFGTFWFEDVKHVSIAFSLSLIYLLALFLNKRYKDFTFYTLFFISMITTSCLSRIHWGGYNNVLIPAYAVISIFFALGVHVLTSRIPAIPNKIFKNIKCFIFAACILQFITLIYNPYYQIPSKEDSKAGDILIQMLSNVKGEIYLPNHVFYPYLVGKKTYAHSATIEDIFKGNNDNLKLKFKMQFIEAIRSEKFEMIIIDSKYQRMKNEIEKKYILIGEIFDNKDVFWPVTGKDTRPTYIYKLKKDN